MPPFFRSVIFIHFSRFFAWSFINSKISLSSPRSFIQGKGIRQRKITCTDCTDRTVSFDDDWLPLVPEMLCSSDNFVVKGLIKQLNVSTNSVHHLWWPQGFHLYEELTGNDWISAQNRVWTLEKKIPFSYLMKLRGTALKWVPFTWI